MIIVNNISKSYGDIQAVDDVSFEVTKGEIIGFLGPNAAGKTTTMRILTGFLLPDKGTASIAGYDILKEPLKVKEKIGYLPENNPLYNDMSVLDYLVFLSEVRRLPQDKRTQRIKETIKICSLEDVIKRNIGELSKGYRQRVGLAQAIIHNPEVLILDEPTSGLDPKQIIEIRELIKELGKEKTVILSTHILPEVSATCSRIIIINKGKIVATGAPQELQEHAGGTNIIYIKIKGNESDVLAKLSEFHDIQGYEIIERENGVCRYKLRLSQGVDISEELFFMVRDNNWSLTELRREVSSLEDIFLHLTTEEESSE
jgi:ABC-2 type transport system ATP-binding protein